MAEVSDRTGDDGRRVTVPRHTGPRWSIAIFVAVLLVLPAVIEPRAGVGRRARHVGGRRSPASPAGDRHRDALARGHPAGARRQVLRHRADRPVARARPRRCARAASAHAHRAGLRRAGPAARDAPRAGGARRARVRDVLPACCAISGSARAPRACATAILACATTTWVYARYPYSEILQLACFLGLFRRSCAPRDDADRGATRCGSACGPAACSTRSTCSRRRSLGGAVVIAWTLRKRRASWSRVLGWAAVTGAPFVALALVYNWARWGSITRTGYEPYLDAYFGGSLFDGAWGMLLSPNKSALLYSPPLVARAASALPAGDPRDTAPRARAARDGRPGVRSSTAPTGRGAATTRGARGSSCGRRRSLLVPIAWCIDARARRGCARRIVVAVVAAGIGVQLLGNALYWDHFIRIAIDAKNQWLGQPNRSGSYIAERGRGHCDSCFEDTYELLWTPGVPADPRPLVAASAVARARRHARRRPGDAPWRTYTHAAGQAVARPTRARGSTGGA